MFHLTVANNFAILGNSIIRIEFLGLSSTYNCQCPFGFTGTDCEKNSFGFDALSYLRMSSLKSDRYDISFEFATGKYILHRFM